jgi:hypothetical protein
LQSFFIRHISAAPVSQTYIKRGYFLYPFSQVRSFPGNLLDRVKADRPVSTGKDKTHVMLIPFSDADTGEVPQISRRIESIIIAEGSRKYRRHRHG